MIGCVIAMESEAKILLDCMEQSNRKSVFGKNVCEGSAFGKDILLVRCGEGKVNAAIGACAALSLGADFLLNFGVAGGLDPKRTEVGEVYLVEKVVQYDFDLTQLTGEALGTLPGEATNFLPLFCPASLSLPRRALGTGDRFNDSPVDHKILLDLGCEIREMEAGAIAQVARSARVPFLSVKAISDVYGSGSTTEQFRQNSWMATEHLKLRLREIIEAIG